MTTLAQIKRQRAYVSQLKAALKQYVDDARYPASASRYGDLDGLIRTAQDYLCVEQTKLNSMEVGSDDAKHL